MSDIVIDLVDDGKMDYFTVANNAGERPSIKLVTFSESIERTGEENTSNPIIHLDESARDLMSAQDLRGKFFVRARMASHYYDMATLQSQVDQLRDEIRNLRGLQPKIVYVEEVSLSDAKERVVKYFEEHSEADLEELMINLKIPVRILVDVIDELRKEGTLSPAGEE